MEDSVVCKNKAECLCPCHFPTPLCCSMNCCCSPIYFLHDSSPNLSTNFCHVNESQPLLIPKKEKELFLKSEKVIKKKEPETPNKTKKNNPNPLQFNKINKHLSTKSNNININLDIEDSINNIIKHKNGKKNSKNRDLNGNIENDKNYNFKKIKVNKKKEDRSTTCPTNLNKPKLKKIDMNNFIPVIHNKKGKGKYFNNYELDKVNTPKAESFINKKNINNMKYSNKNKIFNRNLKNNYNDNKSNYNSVLTNKLQMGDLSDDIIDIQHNYSTMENAENNKNLIQSLRKEIEKGKQIIQNLKKKNETLNIKLFEKENNNKYEIKINKSTNTTNYNNENENEKEKQFIIQRSLFEKEVNILKSEISEITFKLNEYENFILILKRRNNDQENIIKKKDKEISMLKIRLENSEKENKIKINELNNKKIEMIKEKENITNDFNLNSDNLRSEIKKLNEIILNKDNKIKELEVKFKYEKKYDNKKQMLLNLFFNFYTNVKKLINYEKSNELLKDIIDIMSIDDFEYKLNKVEKKLKQILDDIQIKYGHCFACDIACCTSHVDTNLLSIFIQKTKKIKKVNQMKT